VDFPVVFKSRRCLPVLARVVVYHTSYTTPAAGWEVHWQGYKQCGDWRHAVTSAGGKGVCRGYYSRSSSKVRGTNVWPDGSYWPLCTFWNTSTNTYLDKNSACVLTTLPWHGSLVSRTWKDKWPARSNVSKSTILHPNIVKGGGTPIWMHSPEGHA
jgi:hypothetical protein